MNVNFNSFYSYTALFFKKSVFPALSTQQRKIALIVTLAFGCLAALYTTYCYCFKTQAQVSKPEKLIAQKPIPQNQTSVMTLIPKDVLIEIFKFVEAEDILNCRETSKYFKTLLDESLYSVFEKKLLSSELPFPHLSKASLHFSLHIGKSKATTLDLSGFISANENIPVIKDNIQNLKQTCPHIKAIKFPEKMEKQVILDFFKAFPLLEMIDLDATNLTNSITLKISTESCKKLHVTYPNKLINSLVVLASNSLNLEELHLEACEDAVPGSNFVIESIFQNCKRLTKLSLVCHPIASFTQDFTNLNLKELSIQSGSFTEDNLAAILKGCKNLTKLFLCTDAPWTGSFAKYLSANENLQDLTIVNELADSTIEAILKECPYLKKLSLHNDLLTGTFIALLPTYCPNLEELDLSQCSGLNHVLMMHDVLKNVKKLILKTNVTILGNFVASLTIKCPDLEYLNLDSCRHLTDLDITTITQSCQNLKNLSLRNTTQLTGRFIADLAINCPHLEKLNLGNCSGLTDTNLTKTSPIFKKLKKISLNINHVMGSFIISIAKNSPNLESFNLTIVDNLTDTNVVDISQACPQLKSLSISCNSKLKGDFITILAENCLDLEKLKLNMCKNLTSSNLAKIAQVFKKLRKLTLSCDEELPSNFAYDLAINSPNLEYLNLYHYKKASISLIQKIKKSYGKRKTFVLEFNYTWAKLTYLEHQIQRLSNRIGILGAKIS